MPDQERSRVIQAALQGADLDAVVCALPAYVLLTAGGAEVLTPFQANTTMLLSSQTPAPLLDLVANDNNLGLVVIGS